jgi:nucleoside-diphosphate-sugar epimerase
VRALSRSATAAEKVTRLGAEPVISDLSDPAALAQAMDGCDVVVHAAARTTRGARRPAFWRDNVDGTRNVVTGAGRAGVHRVVHVSTEAALMVGQPLVAVDERVMLRPGSPAHYAASKAAAEQVVLEANSSELETVVVRPRAVWGAGDATILPELVAAIGAGRFAWIGGGQHMTDTTHVDNVVHGLMLAATKGAPGEAYFVTDDDPITFREFITGLLATHAVTPPGRSLPIWLARILTRAGESTWQLLRLPGAPPLDYMTLWLSSQECTIDITKARTELGYAPVRTRGEGLAEMREMHLGQRQR